MTALQLKLPNGTTCHLTSLGMRLISIRPHCPDKPKSAPLRDFGRRRIKGFGHVRRRSLLLIELGI